MKSKIAVILVAGTQKQNTCFFPSYYNAKISFEYDLIVVHRNMQYVPTDIVNNNGQVIFENKIFSSGELEHKAFGAYRYYFNKYKTKYDYFCFISDDVVLKRNNWLEEIIFFLDYCKELGFVGSQIFNSLKGQYPHESHCRAPLWASKTESLKKGISEAKELFKTRYSITERGLKRALWAETEEQLKNVGFSSSVA